MNGEVVHQSTYRSITAHDLKDEEYLQRDFDKKIEENLGPKETVKDNDDTNMDETPRLKCTEITTVLKENLKKHRRILVSRR